MPSHPVRQGSIYWLDGCAPLHGEIAKRRPVVVVSPPEAIKRFPQIVVVVACTSSPRPSDPSAIELPSRERTPQTKTGLPKRTGAVSDWTVSVPPELLSDYIGYVSGATLRTLVEAVDRQSKRP